MNGLILLMFKFNICVLYPHALHMTVVCYCNEKAEVLFGHWCICHKVNPDVMGNGMLLERHSLDI